MPLRATLNDNDIQSFNYDYEGWASLKETYKNQSLIMPCCQMKAVPKTSKLGTQYFAHARRGDCDSNPETKEHIHLKFLIAKVAKQCGWDVITEHEGYTPDGEKWIADVYCQKGSSKLAFEVQWSHQTIDEYLRRTEKYTKSDVRCAWLFRLKGKREYYRSDFVESYLLPYFSFRHKDDEFVVTRYDTPIQDFVIGMLSGHLAWLPKKNDFLNTRICYTEHDCWRCRKPINIITSLDIYTSQDNFIETLPFTNDLVAKWIANHISERILWKCGIGTVKMRYSKTVGGEYMSNGCVHCDALQGNFFVTHELEYDNDESFINYQWSYSPDELPINAGWFFRGSRGRSFY